MDASSSLSSNAPAEAPLEGVAAVREQLTPINPSGINPKGRCLHCAVETAEVLISERNPQLANGSVQAVNQVRGEDFQPQIKFKPDGERRVDTVIKWLTEEAAPGAVYVVEPESHAYNFVKGQDLKVYLIDSSQLLVREVKTATDFIAPMRQKPSKPAFDYNYANPDDGEDFETMDVYYWGQLNNKWRRLLK
jgi:hypothetical protein